MLNLITHQLPDVVKIYLYVKDPLEWKYQLLFKEREKVGIKNLKNPKAYIDYTQITDDVYENLEDLEDYNPTKKRRVLVAFDDMTADMKSNNKLSPIVTELFWNSLFHWLLYYNLISKFLKL